MIKIAIPIAMVASTERDNKIASIFCLLRKYGEEKDMIMAKTSSIKMRANSLNPDNN
jgi:hypothetical protein